MQPGTFQPQTNTCLHFKHFRKGDEKSCALEKIPSEQIYYLYLLQSIHTYVHVVAGEVFCEVTLYCSK